jgi:hypothetical protein
MLTRRPAAVNRRGGLTAYRAAGSIAAAPPLLQKGPAISAARRLPSAVAEATLSHAMDTRAIVDRRFVEVPEPRPVPFLPALRHDGP